MPAYPVVNRRNISTLVRRSLHASDEAVQLVNEVGARLHVSQGSLVDTALRHLAAMPDAEIARLLRAHDHLTDDEYAYVMGPKPEKGRK